MPDSAEYVTPVLADEIRMFAHSRGQWLPLDLARHLAAKVVEPLIAERMGQAWDEGFTSDYEGDGWPANPYRLSPASTPEDSQS